MGALFSTATDSSLTSGLTGSLKNTVISGVKGKASNKMMDLLQKVIERYMNDACTNPTAFIQKVLDDMKSSMLFPSAVRISLEGQRADVEAAIREVIKTPEMQKACASKDAKEIAQLIMDIMQGKIDLDSTETAAAAANVQAANATGTAPVNAHTNDVVKGGRRSHRGKTKNQHRRSYRRSYRRSHRKGRQ